MLGRTFFGIAAAVLLAAVGLPGQVQAGSVLPAETEAGRPGDLPPPAARRTPGRPTVIPNTFIVQVEEGADPGPIAAAVARFTGGAVLHVYTHALKGFAIRLPPGLVIADIVAAHPQVLKVEPDLMAFALAPPGGGPIATDDTAVTNQDTSVTIHVLKNDSGKKLTVTNVTDPPKGAAVKTDNAKMVIYSPTTGFIGSDSFNYTITDKDGLTASAMVTVTVNGAATGNPPQAVNDTEATDEDTALNVAAPGVLGNDTDPDSGQTATLTVTAFDAVSAMGAAVNVNADGSYSYDPIGSATLNALAAGEPADDTFSYTVSDVDGNTATATVTVTVTGVNDPVSAANDSESTDYDAVLNVPAPGVLGNDTDPDTSDTLTVTIFDATSANGAAVTVNPDGSYSYDPTVSAILAGLVEGESTTDTFSYTVSDGTVADSATVTVTVTHPLPSTQVTAAGILRIGANPNPGTCGDVNVAILDTGADLDHPDLNVVYSQNFVDDGHPDGEDGHGHGSHVAGIVGALDNTFGVVGVCPGAGIVALRVLNDKGSGSISGIIAALDWVAANADPNADPVVVPYPVAVANMSLGAIGVSDSFQTAVQNTVNAGVVVAVAAGNEGEDIYGADETRGTSDDTIPAAYSEAATIAAMADYDGLAGGLVPDPVTFCVLRIGNFCFATIDQYDDTLAFFSNHNHAPGPGVFINSPGGAIDVAAPGVVVYSTYKDAGYATISGTSMASPHYAGAVARYILANGGRDQNSDGVIDGVDVTLIRQGIVNTAESQYDWRLTPPPTSFIEGIADDCAPEVRPPTEDIDCNFEPLVDVEAFEPGTS